MRIKFFLLFVVAISFIASSCQNAGSGKKALKTAVDSTSYAIGVLIAQQNKQILSTFPGGEQIDRDLLSEGMRVALRGDSTLFSPAKASELISAYVQKEQNKIGQANLEAGNAFLEKNKTREGVITTPSGMQYEIIKQGTGSKPSTTDMVRVHYHGTMIDGKVFDSSVDRGQPAEFTLDQVIPGWTEALQMMSVGSKWKIYLPSNLAYGENGDGRGTIQPNTTLIFEVELLDILPPAPAQEKK
jgi:FKBP-type peptidyl-prolyl cis-trans isomerase